MSAEDADPFTDDDSQDNSTVTEGSSTSSSADSSGTARQDLSNPLSSDVLSDPLNLKDSVSNKMSDHAESRVFGDQIQKYSQIMTNALSKYKVSDDLTDENYVEWSQSLMEVFRSLEFHHYFKKENFRKATLSDEEHEKTLFNLTMYILQRLDTVNKVRTRNHLTDPKDASEIIYDPFKCWNFLKSYHNRISEDKLEAVTRALYACQITKADTLTSFIDKFENLVREFYRLKGELSDIQSARMLLGAIPSLSAETKDYIHNTVVPLTREGVGTYLRKYEERHGWTCAAIREVNAVSVRPSKKTSGECTPDECVGPHLAKNCWSKPENADKRLAFLAKIRAKSGGGNSSSNSTSLTSQTTSVKGVKKVFDASHGFSFTQCRIR
ncbi:uncharacterized protein MELLADRAFT_70317 [Melampsora larici-populina 98AG31]|uniref:Uncharacterized protein n=1 Tax=Melampsora larici-populina (strain 98AG31 / pathotype 3-4-7) TaxID=747676 RepID=F4SEH0_MELLP|nr:uncharacterized protein MELLADRAFT_70317 [Melampsora larici-populina 98AG31]EGF96955.1 hypothetical protein MELLADRAFT_70317 [Melampsora larici-populina 98AG31]